LEVLQRGGLLAETASGDESFLPARDIAGIQVKDILRVLRTGRDDAALMQAGPTFMLPAVEKVLERLEYDAAASTVAHLSLRDLVLTAG
jgi:hypothetical protein